MRSVTVFAAMLLAAIANDPSQAQQQKRQRKSVFAPIKADPNLPNVLIVGDSISIGYTLPTRKLLAGKANVYRIPTNGGPTTRGLQYIEKWMGDRKWDVIHFNWGLHDLKMDAKGKHQVPIDEYRRNLEKLVRIMKPRAKVLIWASTTPVPQAKVSPPRRNSDVIAYNKVAAEIMKKYGVGINDLYSAVLPRLEKLQRPANVHFTREGSEFLAQRVAAAVEAALRGIRTRQRGDETRLERTEVEHPASG